MMDISHGVIWFAPIPKCPTHGMMHYSKAVGMYICHGFDGEGCPYTLPDDDLDWSPLGTTDLCRNQK